MSTKKISELLPLISVDEDLSKTFLLVVVDNSNNLNVPIGLRIKETKKATLQQINDAIEANIPITVFAQTTANTANLALSTANTLVNLSSLIYSTANLALERVSSLEGIPPFFEVEYTEQEITSNFSFRENSVSTSKGLVAIGKNVTVELTSGSTWILDN